MARRRGMTLLEVLVAVAILGVVIPVTYRIYSQNARAFRSGAALGAVEQVEEELKTFTIGFVKSFVDCASEGCPLANCPAIVPDGSFTCCPANVANPGAGCLPDAALNPVTCNTSTTSFGLRWLAKAPAPNVPPTYLTLSSGLRVELVTSVAQMPPPDASDANNEIYTNARGRCETQQTFKSEFGNVPADVDFSLLDTGIYFCLRLSTQERSTANSLESFQPVLVEMRYQTVDSRTMKPIPCTLLKGTYHHPAVAGIENAPIGLVYYTIYWRTPIPGGRKAQWHMSTSSFLSGGAG